MSTVEFFIYSPYTLSDKKKEKIMTLTLVVIFFTDGGRYFSF